jgi:adenine-specific DNA-methyltransferase
MQVSGLKNNDICLDFFAGSGSTAQALFQHNCNSKFILVQLPEPIDSSKPHGKIAVDLGFKTIADISKERIRRAGKKIKEESPDYKGDLGFKVFKLDSSNIKRWDADFDTLESDLMDAVDYLVKDRTDEDVLYELCLKLGLDLTIKIEEKTIAGKKLFILGRGYLVVCLDDAITMDLVNGIGALKDELAPEDGMRVVFKDDGFKDDVVKTNALQTLKRFGIDDFKSL